MLVATYEGEHNHQPPAQQEGQGGAPSGSSRSLPLGSVPCTLDLTKSKSNANNVVNETTTTTTSSNNNNNNNNNNKVLNNTTSSNHNQLPKFSSPEFQKLLAEQMASSLTKDPNFTAALAAAITGRFVQQTSSD
ncbi:hypothetical protein SOVF_215940 [Spinacia oleracea]|nr:hypothetical protein SOVF_215940 [Spinacia oleracea]